MITKAKKDRGPLYGLNVYSVIWDGTIRLDHVMTTVLYIKALWELADEVFKKVWFEYFNVNNELWRDKIERWTVLSDNSVVLILKNHRSTVDIACSIAVYLHNNLKKEEEAFFSPVYIVIDSGSFLWADEITLQDVHIPWNEMETGNVYISQVAYNILIEYCPSLPTLIENTEKTGSFIKLTANNHREEEKVHLFLHHDALSQGECTPCYYCGSKKHLADRCPSKELPEITNALNKLGYKSIEEINKIFFDYFTKSSSTHEELENDRNNDVLLAHQVFYDLKRTFQLRFFRTIWDTLDKVWDNVKNRMCEGNRSGVTWIAQDCIRISDLQKAQSLLDDSLLESPEDYKVYCAWGYMNIEKNNFSNAEQFIEKALSRAKTDPQKIFLKFLLYRIYALTDNTERASEEIKEILTIDPHCSEAIYIDILLQFRKGVRSEPLRRLLNLIQKKREYYLFALIDPELKSFSECINPHLVKIFNNVKDDAKRVLRETEEELRRLKKIFGHTEDVVKNAEESWLMINKLADSESYFGFLDAVYHGLSIMKTIHRTICEYKKELSEALLSYTQQISNYINFLAKYPNEEISLPLYDKLEMLQRTARENWRRSGLSNVDELMIASKNKQLLFEEMDSVGQEMKKLMTIQWMRHFYANFMKRNIIFISIIFTAALIMMPIVVFYVNLILLKFNILPIYDIWSYQKMVMIIGFVCSIITSFLVTFMEVSKKDYVVH